MCSAQTKCPPSYERSSELAVRPSTRWCVHECAPMSYRALRALECTCYRELVRVHGAQLCSAKLECSLKRAHGMCTKELLSAPELKSSLVHISPRAPESSSCIYICFSVVGLLHATSEERSSDSFLHLLEVLQRVAVALRGLYSSFGRSLTDLPPTALSHSELWYFKAPPLASAT